MQANISDLVFIGYVGGFITAGWTLPAIEKWLNRPKFNRNKFDHRRKLIDCINEQSTVEAVKIEWMDCKNDPPGFFGWYLVALLPVNHKDLSVEQINHWRKSFGCTKAWYNSNGQWFEPDAHGRDCVEITERVTHWAQLLSVPVIPDMSNN